jgi:hypothetical protein
MYNPMTSFYFRQGGRHQSELLDFFTGILQSKEKTVCLVIVGIQNY